MFGWNYVAQRCVRAHVVLGRYEPWMPNASLQGGIYGVPKTIWANDAPDARLISTTCFFTTNYSQSDIVDIVKDF